MQLLKFIKKILCKEEKIRVFCSGKAEMVLFDRSSTATKILRWLDKRHPEHSFIYGSEKGTIALVKGEQKHLIPFGNYFVIVGGELFLVDKKIIEGILDI